MVKMTIKYMGQKGYGISVSFYRWDILNSR